MAVRKPKTIEEAAEMAREAALLHQRAEAISTAVADALPSLRVEANVSQTMLASASGLSQGYISQIESSVRVATPTTVLLAADGLRKITHDARADLERARGGKTK